MSGKSGNIPNLVYVKGEFRRLPAMKRWLTSPTVGERARMVSRTAKTLKLSHFAIRLRRKWQVWEVDGHAPILEDLSDDAVRMWLLHRSK